MKKNKLNDMYYEGNYNEMKKANFVLTTDFGDEMDLSFHIRVKKTWLSWFKWKLFCLVFPFKFEWVKEE